jgi:hypothetical protein
MPAGASALFFIFGQGAGSQQIEQRELKAAVGQLALLLRHFVQGDLIHRSLRSLSRRRTAL